MISEKIYDQFYNELDEALKDNNNKMKNSSKNSKIIVKNIITTANEKEIKNIYNNDDGMYIKDLSTINLSEKEDFENKKESMMQLERELKKLLQLQKEQIEYKKKIEKQLEEQKKILEMKEFYENKKKEYNKQLNLVEKKNNKDQQVNLYY